MVRKLNRLRTSSSKSFKRDLPSEKVYPVNVELQRKLLISS